MTIAACYLSPEGVVLGADSAATFGSRNHFLHEQKIFEVGNQNEATLGLTMWGLGSMGETSYRTLIARFSDHVLQNPHCPVGESASQWAQIFWGSYTAEFRATIDRIRELKTRTDLTDEERGELEDLVSSGSGGFCLGGYALPDRIPKAYSIKYSFEQDAPEVEEIMIGTPEFWGQPNMLKRLSLGIDINTYLDIIHAKDATGTPLWQGTDDELIEIVVRNKLGQPSKHLPIREAIDWVYSSIYTTIKAMKFANLPPVCGGPIEIAVVTSDRPFRWVRHKELDTAIGRHPNREM